MAKSLEQQNYEQALEQIYEANIRRYIIEEHRTIRHAETCIEFLEGTKDVKFLPIIKHLRDIIKNANLMIKVYNAKLIK